MKMRKMINEESTFDGDDDGNANKDAMNQLSTQIKH